MWHDPLNMQPVGTCLQPSANCNYYGLHSSLPTIVHSLCDMTHPHCDMTHSHCDMTPSMRSPWVRAYNPARTATTMVHSFGYRSLPHSLRGLWWMCRWLQREWAGAKRSRCCGGARARALDLKVCDYHSESMTRDLWCTHIYIRQRRTCEGFRSQDLWLSLVIHGLWLMTYYVHTFTIDSSARARAVDRKVYVSMGWLGLVGPIKL